MLPQVLELAHYGNVLNEVKNKTVWMRQQAQRFASVAEQDSSPRVSVSFLSVPVKVRFRFSVSQQNGLTNMWSASPSSLTLCIVYIQVTSLIFLCSFFPVLFWCIAVCHCCQTTITRMKWNERHDVKNIAALRNKRLKTPQGTFKCPDAAETRGSCLESFPLNWPGQITSQTPTWIWTLDGL